MYFNYYKKKFTQTEQLVHQQQLIPVHLLDDSMLNQKTIKVEHSNGFSIQVNPDDNLDTISKLLNIIHGVQ